jgi:hypothetical protein
MRCAEMMEDIVGGREGETVEAIIEGIDVHRTDCHKELAHEGGFESGVNIKLFEFFVLGLIGFNGRDRRLGVPWR